jgi:thiol-disulfide isomerase/thioredoxin
MKEREEATMTISPRLTKTLAGAFAALLLTVGSLSAQGREAFTEERFEALQAAGELVLVSVHADWCGTCARQSDILSAFPEKNPDTELYILVVDFDKQKDWVRHFGAPSQSTLILYRGEERVWFSVGETGEDKIYGQITEAAAGAR